MLVRKPGVWYGIYSYTEKLVLIIDIEGKFAKTSTRFFPFPFQGGRKFQRDLGFHSRISRHVDVLGDRVRRHFHGRGCSRASEHRGPSDYSKPPTIGPADEGCIQCPSFRVSGQVTRPSGAPQVIIFFCPDLGLKNWRGLAGDS